MMMVDESQIAAPRHDIFTCVAQQTLLEKSDMSFPSCTYPDNDNAFHTQVSPHY